ncbi:NACHT protein; LRR and PYD domains-containing protein 4A [Camelus dromedarius]|uniref:NACHT protein n=1 Tax=Camelus dromedarius TaxID=9838 RepID=A0A5N4DSF0_CAMDR|nr:NACHT protein; LRR and PYD domains-containing protein 4A [Camelus dromedarius]
MAESERLRDRQTAGVLLLPVRDAGEGFAQRATAFFRDLNFSIMNDADLAVSAYCLKRCSGLRTLCFSVPDVFKEETAESSTPHLRTRSLSGAALSRQDVKLLCEALRATCSLEELPVARCCLSVDGCRDFSRILQTSRKLKQLNVSYSCLDKGMPVLCEALCHPDCALEVLELVYCSLSERCWEKLYEVLLCNRSLTHLDLTSNVLRFEELQLLCKALKQPGCPLQSLWLGYCKLTSACCQDLASILTSSKTLRILNLGGNPLDLSGVVVLCEA